MTPAAVVRFQTRSVERDAAAEFDLGFADAVVAGLRQMPRSIPARYFYDQAGSGLFEQITGLAEYYPTRVETGLLADHAAEIGAAVGPGRAVVEFGSGSSAKTPLLLRAVAPSAYVPIDISGEFLQEAAAGLAAAHPGLRVVPVVGDFSRPLMLPKAVAGKPLLGFFPGSTIGNFSHAAAIDLLRSFRGTLGGQAWLVIGFDTRKEVGTLLAAYDDAAGVTAAFNLNLLHRMRRDLGAELVVEDFAHAARWNEALGRIEMHLEVRRDTVVRVADETFALVAGESIHTENSYKYTLPETRLMAHASGWTPVSVWTDPQGLFGVHLWRAAADRLEP